MRFPALLTLATIALGLSPTLAAAQNTFSLRFYGHGVNQIDRVEIRIDSPARPADVGAGAFTIEFWMKANGAENGAGACVPGQDGWITGNIIVDRDTFGAPDFGDFGIAMFDDGIGFGVAGGSGGIGLCGATQVDDGVWHHVAVTRSGGTIALWVDGQLDGTAGGGPTGDLSYRDGRSGAANDRYLVLGAEKHDAGPEYPSYSGWLDELRISTVVRYTAPFTPPTAEFDADADTAALYHFNEGPAGPCTGTVLDSSGAAGGPSNGECNYGGSAPAGPLYSTDVAPIGAALCGNGDLDPGEGCDDGNLDAGDACGPDCQPSGDALLEGRSLVVRDRALDSARRRLLVLSRDPLLPPVTAGSAIDPRTAGASLVVARGLDEVATIALPAAGWVALGNPPGRNGYRYRDRTQALGPCKSASLRPGRGLKLVCTGTGIGYTLDEPSQGELTVTFRSGSEGQRSCMVFGGTVLKDTSTAVASTAFFRARLAPRPASCPLP